MSLKIKQCFCGCSLQTGAQIISIVSLIVAVTMLITTGACFDSSNLKLCMFALSSSFLMVTCSVRVIYSAWKNDNNSLLIPWLVLSGLMIIGLTFSGFVFIVQTYASTVGYYLPIWIVDGGLIMLGMFCSPFILMVHTQGWILGFYSFIGYPLSAACLLVAAWWIYFWIIVFSFFMELSEMSSKMTESLPSKVQVV